MDTSLQAATKTASLAGLCHYSYHDNHHSLVAAIARLYVYYGVPQVDGRALLHESYRTGSSNVMTKIMDIVASPTSTSAEEAARFPPSENANQPRAQPQPHGDSGERSDRDPSTKTTPPKKHL